MNYLVAIDSLKGCLTSTEANQAAVEGLHEADAEARTVVLSVSDGGEGWLDALAEPLDAQWVLADACDALERPMQACYAISGSTAVIEVARVVGLPLIRPDERDVMRATSRGVGMLMADAIGRGCRRLIIGLGGSAVCDTGRGMVQALRQLGVEELLAHCAIVAATDVGNPLLGPEGAAHVFAPQKGATPEQVEQLERMARETVEQDRRLAGYDCSNRPGAGAAGGLGYALMQHFGAEVQSGADLLLDLIQFDKRAKDVDLVITGEGSSDRQTLMGKLPQRIMQRARRLGVPTWLVAGRVSDKQLLLDAGFSRVVCINPAGSPPEECMRPEVARMRLHRAMAMQVQSL